jgi:arabinogalactan endo-1,4-beta-galactosidase
VKAGSSAGVPPAGFWEKIFSKRSPSPRIMLHSANGGNIAKTKWFFDNVTQRRIPFDVIGLSYYPRWHGTLTNLHDNLAATEAAYHKDVIIVETGYNSRPTSDSAGRTWPFPETPDGQRDFLEAVTHVALQNKDCKGVFWWEPASERANAREFFDENGNSLPALNVFDNYALPSPCAGQK